MNDGNPLISVTIELDQAEYPAADLGYWRQRVRAQLERLLPDAAISVRAGQLRWFDDNDRWSRAA